MKPIKTAILNRKIVDSDEIMPNFHQGLNYGAGIYEGIRFYNTTDSPAIFRLEDHLDRFFYSAETLRMKLDFSKSQLKNDILKLVKSSGLKSGYIRPVAYYSEPKMGINILRSTIESYILVWQWSDNTETKQVSCAITKYRRSHPESIDFKAKITGYYGNNLLGFIDVREKGFSEPIFLDYKGYLAEGAVNNIFLVKDNQIFTPQIGNILSGITRESIITIAKSSGIKVIEKNIKPDFLKEIDGAFLTGTGIEIELIDEIDGYYKSSATPPIISNLQESYKMACRGQLPEYASWLTYIDR